jgi:hypothetical protein
MSCLVCGKAKNLIKSLRDWGADGIPITTQKDYNNRIKACKSCEHFKMPICGKCGCIMMVKARMETSECPIGKWDSEPLTPPASV